eukprot:SAG22_NODE_160_length_16938_cov_3.491241_10_plen_104_part_00
MAKIVRGEIVDAALATLAAEKVAAARAEANSAAQRELIAALASRDQRIDHRHVEDTTAVEASSTTSTTAGSDHSAIVLRHYPVEDTTAEGMSGSDDTARHTSS